MWKKLKSLIAKVVGAPRATARHPQPARFVPEVETLEGRWMPATLPVASLAAASAAEVVVTQSHDIAEAGKVSVQDISFVMKMDKASPKLFLSGDDADAGKVSMQDFSFVKKIDKATPTLFPASAYADAGKVSMQDFHFVMKMNKASPKLFLSGEDADAGKVAQHDISFVKKMDKSSPTLMATSDEAGTSQAAPSADNHLRITLADVLVSS